MGGCKKKQVPHKHHCDICNKQFDRKNTLEDHFRHFHKLHEDIEIKEELFDFDEDD